MKDYIDLEISETEKDIEKLRDRLVVKYQQLHALYLHKRKLEEDENENKTITETEDRV
jgi:hypothetical protein